MTSLVDGLVLVLGGWSLGSLWQWRGHLSECHSFFDFLFHKPE